MNTNFNNWKTIADALVPACKEAVTNVAKAGKGHVQDHIKANNQVRTGFMLNSVYASTPNGSDYAGGDKALAEEKPSGDNEAIVGVAANYAVFPNYGTIHQAPNPFWEPGIEETKADLDNAMSDIAKKLEDAGK
jgi:HK97 gp10 family phage protein